MTKRAFLADEMGLGKTIQALAAIETMAAYHSSSSRTIAMSWRKRERSEEVNGIAEELSDALLNTTATSRKSNARTRRKTRPVGDARKNSSSADDAASEDVARRNTRRPP